MGLIGRLRHCGHVFLVNAFQLRFLLTHAGPEVLGVATTRYSANSLVLAPLLYPADAPASGAPARHVLLEPLRRRRVWKRSVLSPRGTSSSRRGRR